MASTSYSSNPYACEDTEDKVFLLSHAEVTNSAYGFSSDQSAYDTARQKQPTDYVMAQGAYTYRNSGGDYDGNSTWWLRSPYGYSSDSARAVDYYGYACDGYGVRNTYNGVVPALRITLN